MTGKLPAEKCTFGHVSRRVFLWLIEINSNNSLRVKLIYSKTVQVQDKAGLARIQLERHV